VLAIKLMKDFSRPFVSSFAHEVAVLKQLRWVQLMQSLQHIITRLLRLLQLLQHINAVS
jgi:hypothetical protein